MIISKIWIFNLSDIDQGIQKHVIQKKRSLKRFWKKLWREKEKKTNISISRTALYTQKIKLCMQIFFFSKNVCLNTKINLRLEKKTQKIFRDNFKNTSKIFVVAIKKKLVIKFPYMEIVWLVFFFQKTKIKKKSNFSVVAAQNVLPAVELIVQSFFFHKKNFKKISNHTISIYGNCMVSTFFHTIIFPFFNEEIPISIPKQL